VKPTRRERFTETGFLAFHKAFFGLEFVGFGEAPPPFELRGAVAVVTICGPLLQHESPFWDCYEAISERARAAFESIDSRAVLLKIDSPGGDAAGCFELARELRTMAEESGKRLVAYVDGCCASAAYAIASAASEIVAPPTSSIGSIGVFEAHVDLTAQDRALGMKFTFIASGDRKLDGNPHVALSEEGAASIAEKVDLLAGLFFDLVEEQRGLPVAKVAALEGELLLAAQALENGLIDALEVYAPLLERLQSSKAPEAKPMATKPQAKANDKEWEALRTLAESDDEEHKKMAKKLLAKMMGDGGSAEGGEGGEESDDDKKKKDEEAKAKAEADDKDKKDKEEASAKAKADSDAAKAQALSANALAMAQELQTIKAQNASILAERAAEKEAAARAQLFAKRPDFSPAQCKTLETVPLATLDDAVKNWPRVQASVGASANATTAGGGVAGGERKGAYVPVLTTEQQALLDKTDPFKRGHGPKAAVQHGNVFEMPQVTKEQARARLAELDRLETEETA
jgi:capsid assembly protease